MTEEEKYQLALDRFHYMTGSYISARICAEYSLGLVEFFDLSVKGEKTKQNNVIIHENRCAKFADFLGADLKSKGIDLGIAEDQVNRIETVIHACLYLEEEDCKRVLSLIKKMRKEKSHVYTLNPEEPAKEYSKQLTEA